MILRILKDTQEYPLEVSSLDSNDLTNLELMWMNNGDALSFLYAGTPSVNRTLDKGWVPKIFKNICIRLSRNYLNCFQDQQKQDKLNIFMDQLTDGQPENATTPTSSPQFSDAVMATQNIRIKIRQAVLLDEFSQSLYLSTVFFMRAFFSPVQIKSIYQFLGALFWLCIYYTYRLFGVPSHQLVRKTMSLQNLVDSSAY